MRVHPVRRVLAPVLAAFALMTAFVAPARAATITQVTSFGTNPGALRMYRYVPDGLPSGRPLVVVMHGCTQDARTYATNSGWLTIADRYRVSLVLPEQQSGNNANRCFNWFQSGDTARGQGEAASVAQMVQRMRNDYGSTNVYASGLSAGGAMAAVMLATYPDVFSGGAVMAGLPYRCASSLVDAYGCMSPGRDLTPQQWGDRVRAASRHQGPWPTVTVWHGTSDYTVVPANMRELVDQWTNVHGADTRADLSDTVSGAAHAVYRNGAGAAVVETYTINGMGHGHPVDPGTGPRQCGTAGAYVLDVNICAAHHSAQKWFPPSP
ncbi:extracellular catalytic domain type 1 short-chain-length polyhydroxyalkanoate depolymerase [Actinomadura kijaniata]|uniref:extracellular catalytic domain type 1 short-chain-length polyhydroxyalkanoate depolymerase n=1 Tax=Actinomadura kijaniata TaxID=46161 RepID=UPI00082EDD62|nr:PHB depolymerase family esterase [Actinomadura kijaniata]